MMDVEEIFGQLVVDRGLAKPEHVQECLRLVREAKERGVSPAPRLGDLLLERGLLSLELFEKTIVSEPAPAPPPPRKPAVDLPKGEPFGKYIKTVKLGEGGMGAVWKAWDPELRRWVAIKFLKGEDERETARFRREAQLAAHLDHPGITRIYEAGDNYIVMQYVEGRSFAEIPRDDFRFLAQIMRQAAMAVHYAHENHIIHRDLKPANIMLQEGGSSSGDSGSRTGPRVVVMDFGLAKPTNVDSSLSVSGSVVGTPGYMSPEQAKGSALLDHRADIYSLGATMYDLLCGHAPFRDPSILEILRKVAEEEPFPLLRLNPLLPRDLATITMKAMDKEPERRYPTALEFADDLQRFIEGDLILARPVSISERMWRWAKKRRAVLLPSAAAIFLALLIGVYLGVSAYYRAKDLREELRDARHWVEQRADSREREKFSLMVAQKHVAEALALSRSNAEAKRLEQVIAKRLAAIDREEEEERARLRSEAETNRRRASLAKVLGNWERLHLVLEKLEEAFYDSSLSAAARKAEEEKYWKHLEEFRNRANEKDPAAQSMTLVLAGWSRIFVGREAEGLRWIEEGTRLLPENPYGYFLRALHLFYRYLEQSPFASTARSSEGVRFWHTTPPNDLAALKKEIRSLIHRALEAPLWVAETQEDYEFACKGILHLLDGDYAKAEKEMTSAMSAPEMTPFKSGLLEARAEMRYYLRDFAGARQDLAELLERRPREALVHYFLGLVECALAEEAWGKGKDPSGILERAIASFDTALGLQKDHASSLLQRARTRLRQAEWKRGAGDFLRLATKDIALALKIRPASPEALHLRGILQYLEGKIAPAIADFEGALRTFPDLLEARLYLGRCYLAKAKTEADPRSSLAKAKAHLTLLLQKIPDLAEARLLLARTK